MEPIKIVDFSEFKRGMLGLLKLLMYEAMQSQRLDHYAMYKTMLDITNGWKGLDYLSWLPIEMIASWPKTP